MERKLTNKKPLAYMEWRLMILIFMEISLFTELSWVAKLEKTHELT